MRALQVKELIGPDGLELAEVPEPTLGNGVIVDVEAAGVAFPDLLLSHGRYQLKPELPFIPGGEVAGTVVEAAPGTGFEPGERVMGLTGLNGFAERAETLAGATFRIPEAFTVEQAAGFVLNYHTAHFGLIRRGRLKEGENVLVHGAGGGVGIAAIQVAKAAGAGVIGVASSARKEAIAKRAGADDVIRSVEHWQAAVGVMTQGRGVNVVFDPVGGEERFLDSVRTLVPEGRMLVVGFASGEIPKIAVNRLLLKNVELVGVGWGAFMGARPEILGETAAELERMISERQIRPIVGGAYRLEKGAQALRDLEERKALGKLVLRP
jgi:NADPH2:quinone reductase